jgi:hypothetical protein
MFRKRIDRPSEGEGAVGIKGMLRRDWYEGGAVSVNSRIGAGDPDREEEDLERSFIRFVLKTRRKLWVISRAEGSRLR